MDQPPQGLRLNKVLAMHLGIGRREADDLIAAGKVRINGEPAILGARVHPTDEVVANGTVIKVDVQPDFIYVVMNKPTGYVCSKRQQGDTPTIYSLLPPQYQQLKTVGRLDKDSSGIILLTNNGSLAHQLTHPSFAKTKRYEVELAKPLAPKDQQTIKDHGVTLPDGNSKLGLEPLKPGDPTQWIVTMQEGRNRQIRRTFAALGYTVTKLHRTQFGDYKLGSLPTGTHELVDGSKHLNV